MNKILKALYDNQTVMFNSTNPRYYKLYMGKLYFSDTNQDYSKWKKSNAKMSIFDNEEKWRIV